jgi:hypothetical protein
VECIVGATVEESLLAMFADAGFENIRTVGRLDYFRHSPSPQTREIAASFGAHSVELTMRRGPRAPSPLRQWLRRADPRRWLAALRRRGFAGAASLVLALLACYGSLAAIGLLALLGVTLAINDTLWAGAIAVFSVLACVAVLGGVRRHRTAGPGILAVTGTALLLYALYVDYRLLLELLGFALLAAAVAWDLQRRRRVDAQTLGLKIA